MKLTAQTVMALMMPSVFLPLCFFHHLPLLLYIYIVCRLLFESMWNPPTHPDKLLSKSGQILFQRILLQRNLTYMCSHLGAAVDVSSQHAICCFFFLLNVSHVSRPFSFKAPPRSSCLFFEPSLPSSCLTGFMTPMRQQLEGSEHLWGRCPPSFCGASGSDQGKVKGRGWRLLWGGGCQLQ